MSTQSPAPVQSFSETSIEKIAYKSVETIPTQEPNDRNRLGYHIWRFLKEKQGTLGDAVLESAARMNIPASEAVTIIRESLKKQGIQV